MKIEIDIAPPDNLDRINELILKFINDLKAELVIVRSYNTLARPTEVKGR